MRPTKGICKCGFYLTAFSKNHVQALLYQHQRSKMHKERMRAISFALSQKEEGKSLDKDLIEYIKEDD